jgi:hypothetical protein
MSNDIATAVYKLLLQQADATILLFRVIPQTHSLK